MNIAHCVEQYAPATGGMAEVVKQLSERMVRMGHQVTVFTSTHPDRRTGGLEGVTIKAYDLSGNALVGITGNSEAYLRDLKAGAYDVITLFAAQQWATDAVLPHLHALDAKKVFVPTGFSGLHNPAWKNYYAMMPDRLRSMDLNVFHTEGYQDAVFAAQHGIANTELIPNGASEEEFAQETGYDLRQSLGLPAGLPVVLHIGSFTGFKGHVEAIRMFAKAPTGPAALVMIGNGNQKLRNVYCTHRSFVLPRLRCWWNNKHVRLIELDRARTIAALKQADFFLFPSNLECSPIVLFEAMAAGVPFLSSRAGNAEEIVRWTSGGWTIPSERCADHLERPSVEEGARLLGELMADPGRLKKTGADGHRAWKERFTWQHIAERYALAYQRTMHPSQ